MDVKTNNQQEVLIDKFNRVVDYVRISVTDRCDFRCVYCMDDEMQFVPRAQLLTLEEISQIAQAFTELGVKKFELPVANLSFVVTSFSYLKTSANYPVWMN